MQTRTYLFFYSLALFIIRVTDSSTSAEFLVIFFKLFGKYVLYIIIKVL